MNKLYVGCNDEPVFEVVVIDAGPDTVLKRIRVPGVGDLLYHPVTNRVFVCGDSTKVIDCLTDEIVARLPCRGVLWCYNPVNQLVYLGSGEAVYVLTPLGDSVVATVPGWAFDMAFVPFANKLYASDNPGIRVVDCDSHTVIDTVPVIGGWLLCDTVKAKVYSTNYSPGVAFVVEARTDTLIKSIPLGRYPALLCWNSTNSRVYISDQMDDVVYVIRDTSSGVGEGGGSVGFQPVLAAAVVRGVLRWPCETTGCLVDMSGRRVAALEPGENDVRFLSPGVYFAIGDDRSRAKFVVAR